MKELVRDSSTLKRDRLFSILSAEYDDALRAYGLFDSFLRSSSYRRSLLLELLEVAEGTSEAWEIRRLAVLMIEHQVLRIPEGNLAEFDFLLTRLKLKSASELKAGIVDAVLKEGFSTTELPGFIDQLRRKLGRLKRVHDKIKGNRTTVAALLDFIAVAKKDCKLALARYLFQPDEVADEIFRQVRTSKGLIDLNPSEPASVGEADEHAVARLPPFEADILERLRHSHQIYWVSDHTSSEINSLVEYPLTTVVLVIKLPGSDVEFEIKRAGRRGAYPLGVVYVRDGETVPPSHRLDGGSTQWLLRYESKSVSRLSVIYRLVHGTEAPFPVFHSRSSIHNVPQNGIERDILNYFTDRRGPGREFLGSRMTEVVAAFNDEHQAVPLEIPGEIGLAIQFLGHVSPSQAIMSGTSSFRLDRLAAYLSDDGPETYFKEGLNADHTIHDDKRLADEILDEVLCLYRPPAVRYRSYGQYLEAAFKVEANRTQADRNFSIAMQQIGKFWGMLLALRGNTNGESFVPRNVGLRTVWANGQWQLKVIFMDHDNLNLAGQTVENFQSMGAHAGTSLDELYIWGVFDGVRHVVGAVDCLEQIYRVGNDLRRRGKTTFRRAMVKAYRKTHLELSRNEKLKGFFQPSFVERIRDWDAIVRSYLQLKREPKSIEVWKEETIKTFMEKGYHRNVVLEHVVAAERYEKFLERYAFLYQD